MAVDYSEIFEKAEVGIALNDPEQGTVGEVNEHYAELMGYSRAALAEMPIGEISADAPSFDQEAAMEKIQRALEGERQQFDWLFERADGSRFWAEVVLKRTTLGDSDCLLAFVRDISERKQYERELEQHNQRLQEFASIVSHDLRNPLNVASGHLQQARRDCDSSDLAEVEAAHDRMETLIEDLLALAETGAGATDPEAVHLPSLVEGCWRMVQTDDADLVTETAATVQADKQRLQQLLENLFRNAVEHGGNEVTVTVGDLPDGFYVADDGPGIPEADREEVFETGYSTAPDGTGVGLSIVREITDALDWAVTVTESTAGGARFEITGIHDSDT